MVDSVGSFEEVEMVMRWVAFLLMAAVASGCGDGSDDGERATSDPTVTADTDSAGTADEADDGDPSEESEESEESEAGVGADASGSVSVAGATYDFTDVVECEVGGDFGPDWREFGAWTDDGRVFVDITLASGDDAWMTGFDLSVGLANPRTLDEGNPDEEWTSSTGGSVSPTLTDDGASGTADVTTLGVDGATDAVAEWSFTC